MTLQSPAAADLLKMSSRKGPSEVYSDVGTLQAGAGFAFRGASLR